MIRTTSFKIAAAAAGIVLAGGAAAAALDLPEQSDDGRATAEEHTGFSVPTSHDDHPTPDDHPGGDAADVAGEQAGDTHGAAVSEVARDDSTEGREHGEAVSTIARGDHGGAAGSGGEAVVETPNAGGTATADDASDGASTTGTDNAADQAAAGSGNAG